MGGGKKFFSRVERADRPTGAGQAAGASRDRNWSDLGRTTSCWWRAATGASSREPADPTWPTRARRGADRRPGCRERAAAIGRGTTATGRTNPAHLQLMNKHRPFEIYLWPISHWKLISKFMSISCCRKKISSVNSHLSKEINVEILFRNLEYVLHLFCEISPKKFHLWSAVIGKSASVYKHRTKRRLRRRCWLSNVYFQCESAYFWKNNLVIFIPK